MFDLVQCTRVGDQLPTLQLTWLKEVTSLVSQKPQQFGTKIVGNNYLEKLSIWIKSYKLPRLCHYALNNAGCQDCKCYITRLEEDYHSKGESSGPSYDTQMGNTVQAILSMPHVLLVKMCKLPTIA